jgi:hypothetical protein
MWTVDDPIYSTWNPIVTLNSGSFNNNNDDDDDDDGDDDDDDDNDDDDDDDNDDDDDDYGDDDNNESSAMFYKPVWPAVIFVMRIFHMKTLFIAIKTDFRICEIELRFSWISSFSPDKMPG